eukprot:TRINITY_DN14955_c2_g1_i1.p1 TRINITY_DN14955_c2_g1~~TRINITY_DN14955_c2_g1_i1.p1  ORF type:complete len:467 (+),score=72.39 TRINITY_DN14955_c2_g1_i1:60-1460(+)
MKKGSSKNAKYFSGSLATVGSGGPPPISAVLQESLNRQRKMYEEHLAAQEEVFAALLEAHEAAIRQMQMQYDGTAQQPVREGFDQADEIVDLSESGQGKTEAGCYHFCVAPDGSKSQTQTESQYGQRRLIGQRKVPTEQTDSPAASSREQSPIPAMKPRGLSEPLMKELTGQSEGVEKVEEEEKESPEEMLDMWKQCSGIHTVEKWVGNYKKHPAGWGALLMIHGIPEITGRLRNKVDNFAIYSALFLSMSIPLMTDAPDAVTEDCEEGDDIQYWLCVVRKRLYFLGFAIGIAAHMLSILLGMSFSNALNEAARDSDVFRMFSRGKGFKATVKCQNAFVIGCLADFVAVLLTLTAYLSWYEAGAAAVVLTVGPGYIFLPTSKLLFSSASLVSYWRTDLGGKPDADDPYDLDLPIEAFRARSDYNNTHILKNSRQSVSKYSMSSPSGKAGADVDDDKNKKMATVGIF